MQNSIDQIQELLQHLQIITIEEATQDVILWKWEIMKIFSVKFFYRGMEEYPTVNDIKAKSWNIKAPPRVMIFIWHMLKNRILAMDNIIRRGWEILNRCSLCKRASETVDYLYIECQYTTRII